jgi:deazaflavin-dependent oxidoreductase (nitroreductase family)
MAVLASRRGQCPPGPRYGPDLLIFGGVTFRARKGQSRGWTPTDSPTELPWSRSGQTVTVPAHYRAPGWFTRNVVNRAVAFFTRHGVSILGSRVLAVRGRTSGAWRTTPVNLLDHDGHRYLVSARGEGQWVRNLRAAGTGELRVGKRTEAFRGRELSDEEKVPVLRAYLKRWKVEVGVFFDGVGADSTDAEIQAIVGKHPAFEVLPVR